MLHQSHARPFLQHHIPTLPPPHRAPFPCLCTCRTGERIAFSHLISKKFVGETARLELLREGQQLTLDVT